MRKELTVDQKIWILKEEKLRRLKQNHYRTNPMDWLEDKLGEPRTYFQWSLIEGMENHVFDGDKDPLYQMWQRLADSYGQVQRGEAPDFRTVALESGTGTSKTFMVSRLVLWYLDCFPNSLVITTAPKQDQLKIGLWAEISMLANKFKKIRPDSQLYKLRLAVEEKSRDNVDLNEAMTSDSWQAIGFTAGTNSDSSSADKARGFHRKSMCIILEECSGIPQSIVNAFSNTSTGLTNFIVAIGNPSSQFDSLHKLCELDTTDNYRVSALDYPNVVLNKELFVGGATRVSIETREKDYGKGSALYNAMVRGISPTQTEDALIKVEWFDQCIDLVPEKASFNSLGVDVAKSESGDKGAVARFKGAMLNYISDFTCPDASDIAYNLLYDNMEIEARGYNKYNLPTMKDSNVEAQDTGVDVVGVGASTVEMFSKLGMTVVGISGGQWKEAIPIDPVLDKPLYNFVSFRAQIWWQLRMDLQRGELGIHLQDKTLLNRLRKDVLSVRKKEHPKGIALELKTDLIKRTGYSPNLGDAFAYANWMRHGFRRQSSVYFPLGA